MIKKAYKINIATFVAVLFSTIWMFSGIHFGNVATPLEANRFAMFNHILY